MRKRILSLTVALIVATAPVVGQVIITEGDVNHNRSEQNAEEMTVMVPAQGEYYDQWKVAPLGEGALVLAGMGLAYLLSKRKRD